LATEAHALKVTVVVIFEEHPVAVTVPFAQYVNASEVVPVFGIYVNVPLAFRVRVPLPGAARTVTP
jgi:hypothetical protein